MNKKQTKLKLLAEIEGMTEMEMLEKATFDSVSPGICTNPECEYTVEIELDSRDGWCEECQTNSVASALVLANII